MNKLSIFPAIAIGYVVYTVFVGILSPLFDYTSEDRSKDISAIAAPTETPRQDSQCHITSRPHSSGIASWYGPGFHGRTMANGMPYNMHSYTVAHKTLKLGTEVCITNPKNGVSVKAVVTDRGPYAGERVIDLSKRIADELDVKLGYVEISLLHKRKHRHR